MKNNKNEFERLGELDQKVAMRNLARIKQDQVLFVILESARHKWFRKIFQRLMSSK